MSGFELPVVLAALPLLGPYAWWRRRQARRDVARHPPLQFRSGPPPRAGWLLVLEVAILAAVLVGLAGPYREDELELIEADGIDVMLVLDISLSMLAEDFEPTRLDVLRRLAGDFVARAAGHRLGLIVFAGDAFVQSPLTTDRSTLTALLGGVTVHAVDHGKSGGTAIGDALLLAAHRLESRRVDGRDQALVLITDGESNLGVDPLLAARHVRESGIRPYVIGVGGTEPVTVRFEGETVGGDDSPYLAVLDDRQLRQVAEAGGGRYDRALDAGALERLLAELGRLESAPLEVRRVTRRHSGAWLPALAAFALFALHAVAEGFLRRPLR